MKTQVDLDPWKSIREQFTTCPVCTDMTQHLNDIVPGTLEAAAQGCTCTVEDDGRFLTGVLTATCAVHGGRVLGTVRRGRIRESAPDLLVIATNLLALREDIRQMRVEDIRQTINDLATTAREACDWIDDADEEDTTVRTFLGLSRHAETQIPPTQQTSR